MQALMFFTMRAKPESQDGQRFDTELRKGVEATNARDYQTAITHYNAALKEEPRSVSVLGEKAYAHFCLSQDDEAFATCDLMLSLSPSSGRAYYIKGLIYKRKKMKAQALEQFMLAAHNGEKYATSQIRSIESGK